MNMEDITFAQKVLLGKLISESTRGRDGNAKLSVLEGFNWLATKTDLSSVQYYWLTRYGAINDNQIWDEYLSEVVYKILYTTNENFPICPQVWRGAWRTPLEIKLRDPAFYNYYAGLKNYLDELIQKYQKKINNNISISSRTMRVRVSTENLWWI